MFTKDFVRPTINTLYDECMCILKKEGNTNMELSRFFMRCEEHLNFLTSNLDKIDKTWMKDKIRLGVVTITKELQSLEKYINIDNNLKRDVLDMYQLIDENIKQAAFFAGKKSRHWMRNRKGLMGQRVVVFINGHNQVGKDTFIELLTKQSIDTIHNISTVDKVKEAAKVLGWHGEKDENAREALHHIKMLANKHFDHSKKFLHDFISKHQNCVIFVHCREPKELERFTKELPEIFENTICKTLLIKNLRVEPANNEADKNVEAFIYDDTIWNNDSIEEFSAKSKVYLNKIIEEVNNNGSTIS